MHADRTNRTMLIVLALVLLGAGGVGAAASFGVFGAGTKHRALTNNSVTHFIGRNGDWFWPAAAGVALVVVLLSLRWLLALLFSTDRAGDLDIARGGGSGKTSLAPGALTNAVVDEIENCHGVDSAKARVIGEADDPGLVVTATLAQDADLVAVRRRIVEGALEHARTATGNPHLPIQLDLVSAKRSQRVS